MLLRTKDIRDLILKKYKNSEFVIDRTGVKTIEIIGCTFLADEEYIIRKPNYDYIEKELRWYESQSRKVSDLENTPSIWKQIADKDGLINSNYGYLVWSEENHSQYKCAKDELKLNPNSRRASMIYNRPSMHEDFKKDGMNDFVCTMYNQFYIRDNKLISHYVMRSNDLVFGFNNDRAWAIYVQEKLAKDLNVEVGDLIWTASNAHIYERHFKFIEEYL